MAEGVWTTSYCLDKEGFPKILYDTMVRLGILDHPEYVSREYEEYGTEWYEVIVAAPLNLIWFRCIRINN